MTNDIYFRNVIEEDSPHLKKWLMDPEVLLWFPMINEREVDDAVRIWMNYSKAGSGITCVHNEVPCGMFNLYIQPFKKLAHTCLFSIIVDENYRGKGIGRQLIERGENLAKMTYGIEILHLEVYDGNPAQRLYEKMGFEVYGSHKHFIKENSKYTSKIMMQKKL